MGLNYKRVLAAKKAVSTLRLNLLSKANLNEVIEISNSIMEKQISVENDFSREAVIAREVTKTTWKSFCRFGSKRNTSKTLILRWIENKGMPLDEQAMWICENYGMDILPDELASFMLFYDRGKSQFIEYSELDNLYKIFKQIVGFNFCDKFARDHIMPKETLDFCTDNYF